MEYNDGGRSNYFRNGNVRDCAVRAAAIASGTDYKVVYDLAKEIMGSSPRNGMYPKSAQKMMERLGGRWKSCMGIGTGCKVHLKKQELPAGRLVCKVSKHYTAVIDGVINDTFDPSRNGSRCVYGYWVFGN